MINLTLPFFVQMKQAGTQASKDYGVKTLWQSADGSLSNEINIIDNYVNQHVNAILIDPLDAKAVVPAILKAKRAGIPVVTMGNKVDAQGWNYNTLYPDYQNASMDARVLATALGKKGEIAVLTGSKGNFVSDTREAGFVNTIAKYYPHIKIDAVEPTNFDTSKAQSIMQTWLTSYPNLKGIYFISDPLGLAAMAAAKTANRNDIVYVGNDGDLDMHPYLEHGPFLMDVLTGASRVGYWNVAVAARLVRGHKLRHDLFLPTFFVMSKDTAKMLAARGLKIPYITPSQATQAATAYRSQLGPQRPDSALSSPSH
jgi:ribose transport system substrate-binding protein